MFPQKIKPIVSFLCNFQLIFTTKSDKQDYCLKIPKLGFNFLVDTLYKASLYLLVWHHHIVDLNLVLKVLVQECFHIFYMKTAFHISVCYFRMMQYLKGYSFATLNKYSSEFVFCRIMKVLNSNFCCKTILSTKWSTCTSPDLCHHRYLLRCFMW